MNGCRVAVPGVSGWGGRRGRSAAGLVLIWSLILVMMPHTEGRGADVDDDPHAWLEDVGGDRSLEWVRARNAECVAELAEGESFRGLEARLLEANCIEEVLLVGQRHDGDLGFDLGGDDDGHRILLRRPLEHAGREFITLVGRGLLDIADVENGL